MIQLEHVASSIDKRLCGRSGELGYLSRLAPILFEVRSGLDDHYGCLALIALHEPWDDFGMLKNPLLWILEMVSEGRLRSFSRLNMLIAWRNVAIFSIQPSSCG